ncbi:MAG: hypothetical protein JRC86_08120, partial [Deltaproteobacteria bacterium]|nr:hypothetical protein [Deltaproteobacteria bacterium]
MSDQVPEQPAVEPVVPDGIDPELVAVPDAGAVTPEGQPIEGQTDPNAVPGQPDMPSIETPEDVEKARAYFQTKAQQETEARKVAEQELADINAQLDQLDPGDFPHSPGLIGDPPGQVPQPSVPEPSAPPSDEYADPDDLGGMIDRKFQAFEQRLEQREQDRYQAQYRGQYSREL